MWFESFLFLPLKIPANPMMENLKVFWGSILLMPFIKFFCKQPKDFLKEFF